jgi:type I restriction enzyme S subunit
VPFGAETNQISSVLRSLYSRIFKNELESRRLAEMRDTLLPKLMSGELKVNEVEI